MPYNLFLDDIRVPKDCILYMANKRFYWETEFVVVRDYNSFSTTITERFKNDGELPSIVSFDHDLADEHYAPEHQWERYNEWADECNFREKTGYDCAKWLAEFCQEHSLPLPDYIVHSQNPTGAENIIRYLENFKKHVLF